MLDELTSILHEDPSLADLAVPLPAVARRPVVTYADTASATPIYPMVCIPTPGRPGKLWVGRLPGIAHGVTLARELDAIHAFGIQRIVSLVPHEHLVGHYEVPDYAPEARVRFGDRYAVLEVEDFGVPMDDRQFDETLRAVDRALGAGEQVLVHCFAGCGRTGTFVSCLLVSLHLEAREAIRVFRAHRGCGPETPEQVAYVVRHELRKARQSAPPS